MKDCNGIEIQVGDTVRHLDGAEGTVSEVGEDYYICDKWSDGWGSGGICQSCNHVEVISKANHSTTPSNKLTASPLQSLVALKEHARVEIQEVISKYTSLINTAGGTFGVHVSLYDARTMNDYKPEQLVDVNITVTI